MDLRLTEDELAFRAEVRAFVRDNLPASIREKMVAGRRLSKDDYVRWTRILAAKGWGAPHWPTEWGGAGWSPIKQAIFLDETQRGNAPELIAFGVSMVGPVIYTFGSKAQKERFLPRIIDLSDWWCQGFSEPGAGSDLASLRTSARCDGRRLGDLGPEDLDHDGPVRGLDFRPRPHQRAGEKAGRHLVLPGRHEDAGDHGQAHPDDRRRP